MSKHSRGSDLQQVQRVLRTHCMQGIKGCIVCGEPRRPNSKHHPEQVSAPINRVNTKHPHDLFTIEDLAAAVEITNDVSED